MFNRPIASVEISPKKFGATSALIVNTPSVAFAGENAEIRTLPAAGPGNTSNPIAVGDPLNKISNVDANKFGPSTLLGLPTTPAPSTTKSSVDGIEDA